MERIIHIKFKFISKTKQAGAGESAQQVFTCQVIWFSASQSIPCSTGTSPFFLQKEFRFDPQLWLWGAKFYFVYMINLSTYPCTSVRGLFKSSLLNSTHLTANPSKLALHSFPVNTQILVYFSDSDGHKPYE